MERRQAPLMYHEGIMDMENFRDSDWEKHCYQKLELR